MQTLLPDRTVLVTGGAWPRESRLTPTLQSEIYDPATNTWTLVASSKVPRLYHSVALLLPDGRVVVAGGNPAEGNQVEWGKDPHNEEMRLDVYSPPYLFKGPRPVITAVPEEWHYGQAVDISSPQAGSIHWAQPHPERRDHALVQHRAASGRPAHLRPGWRHNRMNVTGEPNIAPPGWYMLFLTDNRGPVGGA